MRVCVCDLCLTQWDAPLPLLRRSSPHAFAGRDPTRSSFGVLRVINDDLVKGEAGFGVSEKRDWGGGGRGGPCLFRLEVPVWVC